MGHRQAQSSRLHPLVHRLPASLQVLLPLAMAANVKLVCIPGPDGKGRGDGRPSPACGVRPGLNNFRSEENTQLVSWADWASNLSLAASCLRGFTLFQAFSFSSSETWRQFQTQEQGWELFP